MEQIKSKKNKIMEMIMKTKLFFSIITIFLSLTLLFGNPETGEFKLTKISDKIFIISIPESGEDQLGF